MLRRVLEPIAPKLKFELHQNADHLQMFLLHESFRPAETFISFDYRYFLNELAVMAMQKANNVAKGSMTQLG